MNSENHFVSICAKVCVPHYPLLLEIHLSTDGDDIISSSKASVTKELCLLGDDSVYTVISNNEIRTFLYDLCTL